MLPFRHPALRLALVLAFALTTSFAASVRTAIEHDRSDLRHESGQTLQGPVAGGSFSAMSEDRAGRGELASRSGGASGSADANRRLQTGRDRSDDESSAPIRPLFGLAPPAAAECADPSLELRCAAPAGCSTSLASVATPPVGSLAPPRA